MKLRYAPASPFVRKVLMVAIDLGLDGRIERELTDPRAANTTLTAENPLGKIPSLTTDDGAILYDSRVICEYLEHLGGKPILPPPGPARWAALRLQALADGISDAAVLRRVEGTLRPAALRWPEYEQRQVQVMTRGLNALEAGVGELAGPLTLGGYAVLATLGYLDFRFDQEPWRHGRPGLASWFATTSNRPCFRDTAPPPA